MQESMKLALQDANLNFKDIDCIFANANSSKDADLIETNAIKGVFKEHSKKMPITAIKSIIGETFSASGAMSTAAAIGSLIRDSIPPTINYKEKDPYCDLDYVPNESRKQKLNRIMLNTFGPNGANTSLIVGRYK